MVSPASNLGKRNRSEITDTNGNGFTPNINGASEIAAGTNGTDFRPNFSDAFGYVSLLKEKLDADKYQNFLNILESFRNKSVCLVECVKMVKDLLEGHPDLLSGFLHFVPKDYLGEIKPDFEDISAFLRKVKSHFSDNGEKYISLLSILNMYLVDRKSVDEVHEEVTMLFQGHPDLIQEFSCLIPKA